MKYEKSCGIIVFDENDKVLMVHHNKGHWGFPKGHVEEGETEEETALREVKEETNCDVDIISDSRLEPIQYSPKEGVIKDVVFFVGRPITKNLINQEIEVSDVLFVPVKEAYELLKEFPDLIRKLKEAEEIIKEEK